MDARKHMIVVGYAKVPAQSTTHATREFFSISLLVEPPDSRVLAVDSTAATAMAREWLSSLLVGADLTADDAPYLAAVDRNYVGTAAGSIKQAIRDAWRRFPAG
ncbi:DUF3870 domain-containing protein [Amycolatopsis sp. CA-230715]|uniref:DUF3870 domain-containing protein n=1 Tax=Amycolatopsis sp. CA-230715 TaxID=2745196 RepID=UPI001C009551|nr:DUF3870 domain-containing protein [Amycolatopsis sp. CA-230715]QWF81180.1 hypothetical protein HUW46_04606 [Amycolatopsis sp. CA-230715]